MRKFNNWLAVKLTNLVGSMWCAYIFCAIALVSLPATIQSGNAVMIVQWIAQTFLQLVLLSVIMVGQSIQAQQAELNLDKILDRLIQYQEQELTELKDDKILIEGEERILEGIHA
jgi:formate/nitrite transporter FocA (FNT family)